MNLTCMSWLWIFFILTFFDGFKKTRPHIDGLFYNQSIRGQVFDTRQCKYGFLTCVAENRFIKPVIANMGLFHLSDQLTCLNNKRVYKTRHCKYGDF